MKIRLFLVDDHLLFTEGLSAALNKEKDMEIINTFSDARKALKALESNLPDLLITDISMPNMNGIEFIKKVKEKYPNLKILVVSMYQKLTSLKEIEGYLLKDAKISEFCKAIRKIVLHDENYFSDTQNELGIASFHKNMLTKREKEIVQLIADELTVNEIAEKLFISKFTVETHKKNIFLKLQVTTNAGLIRKAIIFGFLS